MGIAEKARRTDAGGRTPTPADILRTEFEQLRLDQIGGEPLHKSGFEQEQYELDFSRAGEGEEHA